MPNINKSTRPPWMPDRLAHGRRKRPNREVYGTNRWTVFARRFKMNNPICVECEKVGMISPAEVTDHIKPINEGGEVWSLENLQSLCRRCHDQKSASESRKNRI